MLEASISLPGKGDTTGFWPGFWAMGNLGRPGYASSTDGMWPYSYNDDECDAGITANQSSPDGLSHLPGMRLPSCTCAGEDHPNPGKSRSAPEIDVIEASVGALDNLGNNVGIVSQSAQIAPFDIWYQPDTNFIEVYDSKDQPAQSYIKGGPFQQAVSGLTKFEQQVVQRQSLPDIFLRIHARQNGCDYLEHVGDVPAWKLDGRALGTQWQRWSTDDSH